MREKDKSKKNESKTVTDDSEMNEGARESDPNERKNGW